MILERAAGRVELRAEYRHVLWKGKGVGANDRAGCVEVDEGGAHISLDSESSEKRRISAHLLEAAERPGLG